MRKISPATRRFKAEVLSALAVALAALTPLAPADRAVAVDQPCEKHQGERAANPSAPTNPCAPSNKNCPPAKKKTAVENPCAPAKSKAPVNPCAPNSNH
jgi:hypothetical protein